jgi:biotin carboxyl carrier protein
LKTMSELQRTDGPFTRVLTRVLARQCRQVQAAAGAMLRPAEKKSVSILAAFPPSDNKSARPKWISPALNTCLTVLSSGKAAIVPESPQQGPGAPTRNHIIVIPIKKKNIVRAVAAFLVPEENPRKLAVLKKQLGTTSLLLDYCELQLTLEKHQKAIDRLSLALGVISVCNQSGHFTSIAMALCNVLAEKLRCHRVSLGVLEGRYVRVHAMSRTDTFHREMKLTQAIEAAMEECLDQDLEIICPAAAEAAYVSRAAGQLSQRHGPSAVLCVPVRRNGDVSAVITLERSSDRPFTNLEEIEAVRLACDLCAPRLMDLRENARWFGARMAASVRKKAGAIIGPQHTGMKLWAVLIFLIAMFLVVARGEYRVGAPFIFEASIQQAVVAPFDSYIKSVHVDPSDAVNAGQTILGELETSDLRLELAALKAQRQGHRKQRAASMRDGKTAEAQMAEAQTDKLAAEIRLVERHIKQATLVAPISGRLVSEDLERRLGAPVKAGDVLFEIARIEFLRAELYVPEESIARVNIGQAGELAAVGHPDRKIRFVVERITPLAEVINQVNSFRVRARLIDRPKWMRPGMEGLARIDVGQERYAWIWTHRLTDWLRMKLWL